MDTCTRLLSKAGNFGLIAINFLLSNISSSRDRFGAVVGSPLLVRNVVGVLALAAAAFSFKNLPLVWHWRVFKAIIHQIYLQPTARTPRTLFAPVITSSYNSLYDTDFNLHKSDSTYFADLDVSRAHCLAGLIHTGVKRLQADDDRDFGSGKPQATGRFTLALGGVACYFRREIPPMKPFEIHTRVLTWDHKWLYLLSHFVEKGRIKPSSYAVQPWRSSGSSGSNSQDAAKESGTQGQREEQARLRKYVYATSIARYVFKKGQKNISPEIILEHSSLLPQKQEDLCSLSQDGEPVGSTLVKMETPTAHGMSVRSSGTFGSKANPESNGSEEVALSAAEIVKGKEWTWNDMEAERLHGLEMARHFDALSELHNEQRPGEAVGEYSDWF